MIKPINHTLFHIKVLFKFDFLILIVIPAKGSYFFPLLQGYNDFKHIKAYTYIHTPTLYPRRGSRDISDIFPDAPDLLKLLSYEEYCRRDRW
jgi:hypothetical protein